MPWKNASVVLARENFVLCALRELQPFAWTCREFGISRPIGYKWLRRYRAGGASALHELSHAPLHPARPRASRWKGRVAKARRRRPHWGAKKIRAHLRTLHPRRPLPSVRTIGYWIQQLGLVGRRVQRTRRGPCVPCPGLTKPRYLHQVWTVDFKGWRCTADGQRQQPLTVREAKSRYLLDIRLLADQSEAAVHSAMTRVFRREGLPRIIRVDNGAPFGGGIAALGLSLLSVWWLRLGIRVEFTRRARPGDNAAHEQMHACYEAEVLGHPAAHRRQLQRRTERWRQDYNQRRPHEALGQRTPAQCYRPSPRSMPALLPPLCQPRAAQPCKVRASGDICWRGRWRFIGRAFASQPIALQALSAHHDAVYFGPLLIGEMHLKDSAGMRPAQWSRLPSHPLHL